MLSLVRSGYSCLIIGVDSNSQVLQMAGEKTSVIR